MNISIKKYAVLLVIVTLIACLSFWMFPAESLKNPNDVAHIKLIDKVIVVSLTISISCFLLANFILKLSGKK